jgi:hypothetical protein
LDHLGHKISSDLLSCILFCSWGGNIAGSHLKVDLRAGGSGGSLRLYWFCHFYSALLAVNNNKEQRKRRWQVGN